LNRHADVRRNGGHHIGAEFLGDRAVCLVYKDVDVVGVLVHALELVDHRDDRTALVGLEKLLLLGLPVRPPDRSNTHTARLTSWTTRSELPEGERRRELAVGQLVGCRDAGGRSALGVAPRGGAIHLRVLFALRAAFEGGLPRQRRGRQSTRSAAR
jgi:hypothetical protein